MPPFLSVIVPTMRAGGIDILIDALAAQEYTDFELVLVDALYRHRRDLVAAYARDRFVRLVHVEPRPNPFPVAAFCAMANAGLVAATGEVVVHMVDYSRPRPDCLRRHAEFHKNSDEYEGFMGPHQYIQLDVDSMVPRYAQSDADLYEDDLAAGKLDPRMLSIGMATDQYAKPWVVDGGNLATWDADPKLRMPAGPIAPVFFHGKNESLWLKDALSVNGWDEDLDGTHCYQDSDYADRLSVVAGVQWTLDPLCVVEIANPRGVFPLARRLRDFRENEKIWHAKRAAGYPRPNRYSLAERRAPRFGDVAIPFGVDVDGKILFVAPAVGEGVAVPPPAGLPKDLSAGADFSAMRARADAIVEEHFPGGRSAVVDERTGDLPSSKHFIEDFGVRPLRVAMIYGEFSSAIHGPFDFAKLGESGLTGSEGSFFNLARSLAERGHSVVVLAPAVGPHVHESGAHMLPLRPTIDALPRMELDAVLAWNEPDYLAHAPAGALRVVDQQLNDWGYCKPEWRKNVDLYVFPSASSMNHHIDDEGLKPLTVGEVDIIPNSVDLDLFAEPAPERHLHRVVYCSSPDRGLHHLLAFWPAVRARVPDAELKIFYRIEPWFRGNLLNPSEVGRRARFVEDALRRMRDGFGVEVVGPVPNREMARQLQMAAVLAYTCDPVRYTEGFGCSVLDACAAGCLPIISDADALAEVHGQPAVVISGKPDHDVWADNIASSLERPAPSLSGAMAAHAQKHSRVAIAAQWERLLLPHRRA